MDLAASYGLATNSSSFWARVNDSSRCFEPESKSILPLHIVDIPASSQLNQSNAQVPVRRQECSNLATLDKCLGAKANSDYKFRFISICQKNSWSRLQITKPMLRRIIEFHSISPGFVEVPLGFFDRMTDEEQTFCVPWTIDEDENSCQFFYTFRYAEYKGLPSEPWVIRQAGVYQKIDLQTKQSLVILVSAVPDSAAHMRVLECLESHQKQMEQNPLWVHGVIHASYSMRWREYIAEYEKRLLPIADTTTATFITRPLRRKLACQLENSQRHSKAITRSAQFLQKRSNNTATLLADTLAFRNQGVAQEQNMSMIVLTRSAVFITVITLIYLPWTLVTGIFGMEFFELDTKTLRIVTSPQIWIYFIVSFGATLFTGGLYYLMAGMPQIRKKQQDSGHGEDRVPISLQRGNTDIEKNGFP
ncbi:hypothetical protein BS50DRAFT_494669 [Corynespora cassiicola Philippines]|uniref:CorA-like transporter domain-containing protein n=1 Tax=Corynespora cassiicola Philippines TaxID=1448308 RepID=A0A2T2NPJ5_CORCC|nr:hypothetical protein BS50DRAFT_494669 [Corynespora cassiicola Philippines]